MNKLLIIALIAVVLVSGCSARIKTVEDYYGEECQEICQSNNMKYYKMTGQNPTCYCKDSDGAIKTFVM